MRDGRLRIACAIGQLDPRGSEQQLFNFVKHINRERFAPEVWVMYGGGDWEPAIRRLGVEVIPFSQWRKIERPYRMWQKARQRGIDLWWSWSYYLNLYAYFIPKKTPTIGSIHETLSASRAQAGQRYRLCESGPKLLLSISREGVLDLKQSGHRGEAAWVANSSTVADLSPGALRQWRERLGAAPETRLVVGAGHFEEGKNFGLLLEVFAQLPQTNLRLALVGDGPQRATLEARAARPDLAGKVVFPGRVRGAAQVIAAADLFVHPSKSEGMPNVVMEAICAGVPVVATLVNGVRDLITSEQEGWIVPQGQPAALREAMCAALADLPQARRKAAQAGARIRALHGVERVAGLLEAWACYAMSLGPRPHPFDEIPA